MVKPIKDDQNQQNPKSQIFSKIATPEASRGLSQMKAGDDQEPGRGKWSEKELLEVLGREGPHQAAFGDKV